MPAGDDTSNLPVPAEKQAIDMWQLAAFDRVTRFLVRDYVLHDMSVDVVKRILVVVDDDEFGLPVGIRQSDVPVSKVSEFVKYIDVPLEVNDEWEYEIGVFSD